MLVAATLNFSARKFNFSSVKFAAAPRPLILLALSSNALVIKGIAIARADRPIPTGPRNLKTNLKPLAILLKNPPVPNKLPAAPKPPPIPSATLAALDAAISPSFVLDSNEVI